MVHVKHDFIPYEDLLNIRADIIAFAENYLDFRNVLENQKGNLYIFTNFSEVHFFLQYMHNVKSCNYTVSLYKQ